MNYREILQASWKDRQKINPRFSMRAFAKKLEIEPSTLSQILRGKRDLPAADAQRVLSRLNLSPDMQKDFLDSMDPSNLEFRHYRAYLNTLSLDEQKDHITQQIFSDSWYGAMLALIDTKGFVPDTAWMARRLGISRVKATQIFTDLQVVGLVEKVGDRYEKRDVKLKTTDEISSDSLRRAHLEEMGLAAEALASVEMELRDFVSITLAADSKQIKKAKVLIRSFLKQMDQLLETDKSDEVYQMNVQFFPLSKPIDQEKA
jgi:uncharacterized protein (TIGR02147 family)